MRRWFSHVPASAGGLDPMPVIVGSPRSGTTLLRLMLDSHPELAIPPETAFLILGPQLTGTGDELRDRFFRSVTAFPPDAPTWPDFQIPAEQFRARLADLHPFTAADGFRLFYRMYAARFGKPRWGDKTPTYCRHLHEIGELLPEARFVHLIRDGRDVAVSLRTKWFSPGPDIEAQATYWRENVLAARRSAGPHYLEIRYENLVRDPESELRRVCAFVGLTFHPDMLRYHERAEDRLAEHGARVRPDGSVVVNREERQLQQASTRQPPDLSRLGAWRATLTADECRRFEAVAGDLLADLGYPVEQDGCSG